MVKGGDRGDYDNEANRPPAKACLTIRFTQEYGKKKWFKRTARDAL